MAPAFICPYPAFAAAVLGVLIIGADPASAAPGTPPARPAPNPPPAYALGPPAAIAVLTDKDNGGTVTLPPDTTLIVRLHTAPSLPREWNLLLPPNLPLRLAAPPRHLRDSDEFEFTPRYLPGRTQTFFLRFVSLDPQASASTPASAWSIKAVVPPAYVEPQHSFPSPAPSFSH